MSDIYINGVTTDYTSKVVEPASKEESEKTIKEQGKTVAATYEQSTETKSHKPDMQTIEKMKAEAERRTAQLRSLVEKMMTKQGQTFTSATDFYKLLREKKLTVDPAVAQQAKEDIKEDGYWGVEKTSERLVSFAKALTGNDSSKAVEMIAAIEEGFKQATKAWGDELPKICQDTLERTREKLKAWSEENQ